MNLRVVTETGSVYELRTLAEEVRRLSGVKDPTPRQGPDGEWKHYRNRVVPIEGASMFFDWTGQGNGTMTSRVTDIVVIA